MPDELQSEKRVDAAMAADIPDLYCNGFLTSVGGGDILVILERHGFPVARLNLSHVLAKTLGNSLLGSVGAAEEKLGMKFPTTHEMLEAFEET